MFCNTQIFVKGIDTTTVAAEVASARVGERPGKISALKNSTLLPIA